MRRLSSVATTTGTYSHHATMPRLPVPPLQHTLEWYLRTVQPLVSARDFEVTSGIVADFARPGGVGERLQAALEAKAADPDCYNWLEQWWDTMYIDLRCPNPVHVNYGLRLDLPSSAGVTPTAGGDPQTAVAAKLVAGCLDFKALLDAEELPAEATRSGPLCMNQFARLFAHARVPQRGKDALVNYGRQPDGLPFPHFATQFMDRSPRHVAVLTAGRVFALDVVAPDGKPLPVDDIEAGMRRVRELAASPPSSPAALTNVATLTASDRDTWADARELLASVPSNRQALDTVDSALFVVALETEEPASPEAYSESVLLGGDGGRWFDKHQVVVFPSGEAGANFEHAPGDGTTALRLFAHVNTHVAGTTVTGSASPAAAHVTECVFTEAPAGGGAAAVATACADRQQLMDAFNTRIATVPFGSSRIKAHNCSPDAFAQMAMQLAAYRIHGDVVATYESNSTRGFLHGRTETVRSASQEARRMCAAVEAGGGAEALSRLHDAISAHQAYMKMSKEGLGVDRPLYGLKMLAAEAGEEPHAIFTDASFATSNSWRMSTSHLGGPAKLFTFGPVVDDGFGLGYFVNPDHMVFDVTAWTQGSPATAADMAAAVAQATSDLDDLCTRHATG